MRIFPLSRSGRAALRAWVTCLLLAVPARAQSFAARVRSVPAPPADSAGAFSALARWGGSLFALYDGACFRSADAGATWERRDFLRDGPKGPAPALAGGWFTRTDQGLWLGNREGALAWRFDAPTGAWAEWPAGAGAIAAAGTGDRLYALTAAHRLLLTRNSGVTWEDIPLPDSVRTGTYFDDILAEGEHLVLRVRDVSNAQAAARSFDGGATWAFLGPHALPLLAHGSLYAFLDSQVLVQRPGAEERRRPAPAARAAFADSGGRLFAWSDSGLFAMDALAEGAWSRIADPVALQGWSAGKGILYRLQDGALSWFDGLPGAADAARNPAMPPRRSRRTSGFISVTGEIGFDFGGERWDGVGRRR